MVSPLSVNVNIIGLKHFQFAGINPEADETTHEFAVPINIPEHKAIIIDTEQYAGNFEREMCAYVTGQYGDCGVGRNIADSISDEIRHLAWWTDHIVQRADEHGTERPASISQTPGWFNNGMGGLYRDIPEEYERAQQERIASTTEYQAWQIKAAQDRLNNGNFEADRPGAWTKEACERQIANCEATVQRAISQGLRRRPAYLSVAIFVNEFPPQEVMDELKERAGQFVDQLATSAGYRSDYGEKIVITGVRLVEPDSN